MRPFASLRRALGVTLAATMLATPVAFAAPAQAAPHPVGDLFEISTTQLDFGAHPFGSPKVTRSYTITMLRDAELTVDYWEVATFSNPYHMVGTDACEGFSRTEKARQLTAGSVCTVELTYDPSVIPTEGWGLSSTWSAVAGADETSMTVKFRGSSPAVDTSGEVDRGAVKLTAPPGGQGAARHVTVTNIALVPVEITPESLAAPFAIASSTTCSGVLDVGASCDLGFVYHGGAEGASDRKVWSFEVAAPGAPWQTSRLRTLSLEGTTVPSADLAVARTREAADPLLPGSQLRWQVEVTNHGPSDEPSAVLTDVLQPGLAYDETNGGGCPIDRSWTDGELTYGECEIGPLAVGETRSFTISTVVTTEEPGVLLASESMISGSLADFDVENNRAYAAAGFTPAPVEPPTTVDPDEDGSAPGAVAPGNPDRDDAAPAVERPAETASARRLAQTGLNDPSPALIGAGILLSGGIGILLLARRRRRTAEQQ